MPERSERIIRSQCSGPDLPSSTPPVDISQVVVRDATQEIQCPKINQDKTCGISVKGAECIFSYKKFEPSPDGVGGKIVSEMRFPVAKPRKVNPR